MKKSLGARTLFPLTPVAVVCSYDINGKPNAMTAAWTGVVCSQPPCVGISLRKATYTYGAIMGRRAFTLNIPTKKHIAETDYFGIASGRDEDKISNSGLTTVDSVLVDAPYIKEFPIVMECKVVNVLEIGLHTQFVGEVVDAKVDEGMIGPEGNILMDGQMFGYNPSDRSYYWFGEKAGTAFSIGKGIAKKE